jgi:hypothetical protein
MAGVQGEEFNEGEVWDVLRDDDAGTEDAAPGVVVANPPRNRGGKKAVVEGARRTGKARPSSAPVAIPAAGSSSSSRRRGAGAEEDDDGGGEMLPPHEWLARKMERMMGGVSTPASPPEVFGGRSKGREMRKVRDAVLPKTAFSEQ